VLQHTATAGGRTRRGGALVVNISDKSNNLQTFLRATKPKRVYIYISKCRVYKRVGEMGKIGCQRENDNGIQSAR